MPTPRLIYAAPEHDADMLYAARFFAPDAFLFLEQNGRRTIVLSDLEVDRGIAQAPVHDVVSLSEEKKRLKLPKTAKLPRFAAAFLRSRKIRRAVVPGSFPLGLAAQLAKAGITVTPQPGLFWPQRERKTEAELKSLRHALLITEAGMARAMEVLKSTKTGKKNALLWGGRPLTSEILRAEIESAILRAGGLPANTIVAGGLQACDPHERGFGPLRARELIILDIFPRDARSGYFGDMTRTVVRGRASDAQWHLWQTVRAGQKRALAAMKPQAKGKKIEDALRAFFEEEGYPTGKHNGRWRGFFHGVGHGLGLDIHEEPRFGSTVFKTGQVITVEPGIYWPEVGGARLEDVAVVTKQGNQVISKFRQELEI